MSETISINVESGLDETGSRWERVNFDDEQPPMFCAICGNELGYRAWFCLDGGAHVCDEHVVEVPYWMLRLLRAEFQERLAHRNKFVYARTIVGPALVEIFNGGARQAPHKYLGYVEAA